MAGMQSRKNCLKAEQVFLTEPTTDINILARLFICIRGTTLKNLHKAERLVMILESLPWAL